MGEEKLKEIEARNDKLQMRAVEIFNGIKELELRPRTQSGTWMRRLQ